MSLVDTLRQAGFKGEGLRQAWAIARAIEACAKAGGASPSACQSRMCLGVLEM